MTLLVIDADAELDTDADADGDEDGDGAPDSELLALEDGLPDALESAFAVIDTK